MKNINVKNGQAPLTTQYWIKGSSRKKNFGEEKHVPSTLNGATQFSLIGRIRYCKRGGLQ